MLLGLRLESQLVRAHFVRLRYLFIDVLQLEQLKKSLRALSTATKSSQRYLSHRSLAITQPQVSNLIYLLRSWSPLRHSQPLGQARSA